MSTQTQFLSLSSTTMILAVVAFFFPILVSAVVSEATTPLTILHLVRIASFPSHRFDDVNSIRARDHLRHSWMSQQSVNRGEGSVVNFPLEGTSDPSILGLHTTKVKLGSNPRVFNVLVDTGSDVPWVICSFCITCPQTKEYWAMHNFFDSSSSPTAQVLNCTDSLCDSKITPSRCSAVGNECEYAMLYGDNSTTKGHFIRDSLIFDVVTGKSAITNSSGALVFGCSNYQTGSLSNPNIGFDGIFGFGQGALSIISQLYAQRLAPLVFSHCLGSDPSGGGMMVLGEIVEPSIAYTPLAPSRSHYNVYLQSIAINGQLLPIDPAVFTPGHERETIVDSGTILVHLVEDAFYPLINSITGMVSSFVNLVPGFGLQCYLISLRLNESEIFPTVSFNFAGGTSMLLKPEQYLLHRSSTEGGSVQCLGFMKSQDTLTIFGELVLRDKIVVYDLARRRLGWAPYNCSMAVNVSTIQEEAIGGGQSSSSIFLSPKFIATISGLFLLLVSLCCLALYYKYY